MCIHNTGVDPNSFRMYSSMAVNKTTETFQYGHISQPGSFFHEYSDENISSAIVDGGITIYTGFELSGNPLQG